MIPAATGSARRLGWGEIRTLTAGCLRNSVKYILNVYIPTILPGTGPITTFGGTGHDQIRHPASAAFGIAACLDTGAYDASHAGVSEADATAQAVRLVAGLASLHKANGGPWGGPANTAPPASGGPGWQEALWANNAGVAGHLIWDALSPAQQGHVSAMVAWEANRMIPWTIPFWKNTAGAENYSGDSKREEIAWNASILQLALLMFPAHANAAAWLAKLTEAGLAQDAMPADLTDITPTCGLIPANMAGTNVTSQGGVINHGFLHPDYMTSSGLYDGLALAARAGVAMPATIGRHGSDIWNCMTAVQFVAGTKPEGSDVGAAQPGGTIYNNTVNIYYPNGSDWGTSRRANFVAYDVAAMVHGWDSAEHPARPFALRHLQGLAAMQARFTTGQTYLSTTEDNFGAWLGDAETWVAVNMAITQLALTYGTPARTT